MSSPVPGAIGLVVVGTLIVIAASTDRRQPIIEYVTRCQKIDSITYTPAKTRPRLTNPGLTADSTSSVSIQIPAFGTVYVGAEKLRFDPEHVVSTGSEKSIRYILRLSKVRIFENVPEEKISANQQNESPDVTYAVTILEFISCSDGKLPVEAP